MGADKLYAVIEPVNKYKKDEIESYLLDTYFFEFSRTKGDKLVLIRYGSREIDRAKRLLEDVAENIDRVLVVENNDSSGMAAGHLYENLENELILVDSIEGNLSVHCEDINSYFKWEHGINAKK